MLKITKICSKCKIEQPFSCFGKKTDAKDGCCPFCKKCKNTVDKEAYRKNKDKILKQVKTYRESNKAGISIKNKRWREENKDVISIKKKQYREENKDKVALRKKQYYQTIAGKACKLNTQQRRRSINKEGDVTGKQFLELREKATHCFWCQTSLKGISTHIDHFYPLSKGGKHTLSNLVVSCAKCNHTKSAKDPFDFALEIGKKYDILAQ